MIPFRNLGFGHVNTWEDYRREEQRLAGIREATGQADAALKFYRDRLIREELRKKVEEGRLAEQLLNAGPEAFAQAGQHLLPNAVQSYNPPAISQQTDGTGFYTEAARIEELQDSPQRRPSSTANANNTPEAYGTSSNFQQSVQVPHQQPYQSAMHEYNRNYPTPQTWASSAGQFRYSQPSQYSNSTASSNNTIPNYAQGHTQNYGWQPAYLTQAHSSAAGAPIPNATMQTPESLYTADESTARFYAAALAAGREPIQQPSTHSDGSGGLASSSVGQSSEGPTNRPPSTNQQSQTPHSINGTRPVTSSREYQTNASRNNNVVRPAPASGSGTKLTNGDTQTHASSAYQQPQNAGTHQTVFTSNGQTSTALVGQSSGFSGDGSRVSSGQRAPIVNTIPRHVSSDLSKSNVPQASSSTLTSSNKSNKNVELSEPHISAPTNREPTQKLGAAPSTNGETNRSTAGVAPQSQTNAIKDGANGTQQPANGERASIPISTTIAQTQAKAPTLLNRPPPKYASDLMSESRLQTIIDLIRTYGTSLTTLQAYKLPGPEQFSLVLDVNRLAYITQPPDPNSNSGTLVVPLLTTPYPVPGPTNTPSKPIARPQAQSQPPPPARAVAANVQPPETPAAPVNSATSTNTVDVIQPRRPPQANIRTLARDILRALEAPESSRPTKRMKIVQPSEAPISSLSKSPQPPNPVNPEREAGIAPESTNHIVAPQAITSTQEPDVPVAATTQSLDKDAPHIAPAAPDVGSPQMEGVSSIRAPSPVLPPPRQKTPTPAPVTVQTPVRAETTRRTPPTPPIRTPLHGSKAPSKAPSTPTISMPVDAAPSATRGISPMEIIDLTSPMRPAPSVPTTPVLSSPTPSRTKTPLFIPATPTPPPTSHISTSSPSAPLTAVSADEGSYTMDRQKQQPFYILVPPLPDGFRASDYKPLLSRASRQQRPHRQLILDSDQDSDYEQIDEEDTIQVYNDVDPTSNGFANDSAEREAVLLSCSRLMDRQCRYESCKVILNSAGKLVEHLSREHRPRPRCREFICRWQLCGKREFTARNFYYHLRSHATVPLRCAYQECELTFRTARQLAKHHQNNHSEADELKPSIKPFRPPVIAAPPPITQRILPTHMLEPVQMSSIDPERHNKLSKAVLKGIAGPVPKAARPYNAAQKRPGLRSAAVNEGGEGDVRTQGGPFDFLEEVGAKVPSVFSSQPASRRNYMDIDSAIATEVIEDGLEFWGASEGEEDEDDRSSAPITPSVQGRTDDEEIVHMMLLDTPM